MMSTWGALGLAGKPASWSLEPECSAEAWLRASYSLSDTRTFRRLDMASRLKSVTPRGAGHPPQSERTVGRRGRGGGPVDQTPVCAIGAASPATLSAPSAASILATVGVQGGLLAVPRVRLIKQVLHDQPVSGLRAFDTTLLTLMKGDEVVEALELISNLMLLLAAFRHKVVASGHESPIRARHL